MYAEALAQKGDLDAAIEVMTGALELDRGWAAGWFQLGEMLEKAGQREAAGNAFEMAVAHDPADPLGAGLKRDLLRATPVQESMPAAFVETLFDQYAQDFERSLVGKLNYRGPQMILQALLASGFQRAGSALDLGCGTGLMGEVLRPHCERLTGYDISAGMLSQARSKQVYDVLEKHDIAHLAVNGRLHDLIVAADVFIYLGALERVVAWCAGSLHPAGHLAFTVEAGTNPVELRESRRFAHSQGYVADLLRDAGFASVEIQAGVIRQDRGEDVSSLCVVASGLTSHRSSEEDGEAHAVA
jgi:predicted TPR repeat methyltransferase